jgi:hypothetical protein
MKWKGREQSKNVVDRRYSPKLHWSTTVDDIIRTSDEVRNGKRKGGQQGSRKKPTGSRTGGGY